MPTVNTPRFSGDAPRAPIQPLAADGGNLSIIFQGAVSSAFEDPAGSSSTAAVIRAARQVFPRAQIILSTWEGTEPSYPEVDELVLSVDPGGYSFEDHTGYRHCNNFARMARSTLAALDVVEREYTWKLRTDLRLASNAIVAFYQAQAELESNRTFFLRPYVVASLYTRQPLRFPRIFHPSDMAQIGLTTDVKALWTAGQKHSRPEDYEDLVAEQILLTGLLKERGLIKHSFGEQRYIRFYEVLLSETVLAREFVIADADQMGLVFPSRFQTHSEPDACYSHQEWSGLKRSVQYRARSLVRVTLIWARLNLRQIPPLKFLYRYFYRKPLNYFFPPRPASKS